MSQAPLLTVGPPPHWRSLTSLAGMNYAFILALAPAALAGAAAYAFGPDAAVSLMPAGSPVTHLLGVLLNQLGLSPSMLSLAGALGVIFLGAGTGILAEYATQVVFRQPYHVTNGHGALMGLIMALLMPPTVPGWVLVIGVILAVVIGKQIFGGIGGYPMHPAMVGWLILLLSWQHHIYPVGLASIAAQHQWVILLTLLGGVSLVALGHVRWYVPFGVIASVAAFAAIFHGVYPEMGPGFWWEDMYKEIVTGHVILAAFFIATDSSCSPSNALAGWVYAIALGALIMLIRTYGIWPDAVPFAVLLANVLNPLLDKVRPRVKQVVIQHG